MMYVCGSNHFGQLHLTVEASDVKGQQDEESAYMSDFKRISMETPELNEQSKEDKSLCCCAFSWSCFLFNEKSHLVTQGFINDKSNQRKIIRSDSVSSLAATEKWIIGTDKRRHLWAWDRNTAKDSSVENINSVQFVRVSAGSNNLIAVTDTGAMGKLIEQDNSLLYQPISLAARIKLVSCGKEHVLVATRIGVVLSWGTGSRGQLGHGSLDSIEKPTVVSSLEGLTVLKLAAGGWHSLVSTDQGDMYVWGWNESGQIGLPSVNLRSCQKKEEAETMSQSTFQDISGGLDCQKENIKSHPEKIQKADCEDLVNIQPIPALLDLPDCDVDSTFIKSVSCGSRHSAACTECGQLYTWGWNEYGQLGHGDVISRDIPTIATFFKEETLHVTDAVCGSWNTAVWITSISE